MIKLSYILQKEELIKYYQMILTSSEKAKAPRIIALIWGPTLFAALVLLTKLLHFYHVSFWIIALVLSVIWVIFIYPMAYNRITRNVVLKKNVFDEKKLKTINVTEDDGEFTVDGEKKTLDNYLGYQDMIVLNFTDSTNLIVPQRVFESEDILRQFIRDIMLKVNNKEESH